MMPSSPTTAPPREREAALLPEPVWREDGTARCGPFVLAVRKQRELQVWGEREFEIETADDAKGLYLHRRGLGTTEELTRQSAYEAASELAAEILALADAIALATPEGAAGRREGEAS